MNRMRVVVAVVAHLVVATTVASDTRSALAQAPPACSTPEHRQFDFWIGTWDVTTPDGKPAATNRIELVLGGCVLLEHWEGSGGGAGKSFSMYVAAEKQWSQTWVDQGGNRIMLTGGLRDGKMVLSNAWRSPAGKAMASDLTWTPMSDGRVRQVWRQSSDGGATWTTTFDGFYRRRP
jgi:hypothetical protein